MKDETNKKGRANCVTIFHADPPQLSANPSWRLWHRKVITKTEHTQQNKIIRINKTQERKEEATTASLNRQNCQRLISFCFKRLICALLKIIQPKQETPTDARKTASTAI